MSSVIGFRAAVRGNAVSPSVRKNAKTVRAAAATAALPKEVAKTDKPMNIIFVAAEVAPWSKTGGLGDVVGSLPVELAKRGHKVMSISPRYDQYKGAWDTDVQINVQGKECRLFHEKKKGVDRVFIDNPKFLAKVWGKTGSKLYGTKSGFDFSDNQERFAMFCEAAMEANLALPFGYGEDVVFVANDWHSALVPVFLKTVYKPKGVYAGAKSAMVVHNIAFQGRFPPTSMGELGLPEDAAPDFFFMDGHKKVYDETNPMSEIPEAPTGQMYEKVNWLKAGFLNADKCITVSPNYAEEIMSGPAKGVEMTEHLVAAGGIEGIVNGMDPEEWDPKTDKFLDVPYDKTSVVMGKAAAKQALQAEAGLDIDPSAPIFGYIGRLEEQKGCDIMMAAVPKLLAEVPNAQVVILGTGKKKMEASLEKLGSLPGVAAIVKFSSPLAHFITAGADYLMVPSRFEPCGLIQLHAMQYGTVPIVASTGGLVDTVKEGVTGFHIGAMDQDGLLPADVSAFVETCKEAADIYDTPKYTALSAACIAQDLTWAEPAKKWEATLEELMMGEAESSATKKASVATPVQTA